MRLANGSFLYRVGKSEALRVELSRGNGPLKGGENAGRFGLRKRDRLVIACRFAGFRPVRVSTAAQPTGESSRSRCHRLPERFSELAAMPVRVLKPGAYCDLAWTDEDELFVFLSSRDDRRTRLLLSDGSM